LHKLNKSFKFCNKKNQKCLNEINLGTECEEYLDKLIAEEHADIVAIIREHCLQFYINAAKKICEKLPIEDPFLSKLKVFESNIALYDVNRQTSFNDVSFVAQTFSGFDDNSLKKKGLLYIKDFTEAKKDKLSILNFDKIWKEIFQHTQYLNLKSLVNAIRLLPNSNADSERIFSLFENKKTK